MTFPTFSQLNTRTIQSLWWNWSNTQYTTRVYQSWCLLVITKTTKKPKLSRLVSPTYMYKIQNV